MPNYLKRLTRQVAWLPLCVVGKSLPRDKRLWVFGAWHGRLYADNTRHLFLYIRNTEPTIRAVWLTHDPEVVKQVESEQGEAVLAYSWQGILITLRAGVFLVTHSAEDINAHASVGGTLINLTHGTPLKHLGHDANSSRMGAITKLCDLCIRHLLPCRRKPQLLIVASEVGQQRMMSAYAMPAERVLVTGYPRWEAFKAAGANRLRKQGIDTEAYAGILLYAPTLRREGSGGLDLAQGDRLERLIPWLESERLLLLVRGHVSLKMSGIQALLEGGSPWVREVPVTTFPDVNELLPAVDCLITDYSSLMFDYACLNRPIILMAPDLDAYLNDDVGIYGDYFADSPGPVIEHWLQLPQAWQEIRQGQHRVRLSTFIARHAGQFGGDVCSRVTEAIASLTEDSIPEYPLQP